MIMLNGLKEITQGKGQAPRSPSLEAWRTLGWRSIHCPKNGEIREILMRMVQKPTLGK